MNDTTNILTPATPETARSNADWLRRLVRRIELMDVSHKRPRLFYTKSEKTSGALKAGGIGDIVKPTSNDWRDHFQCTPRKRHEHVWLLGEINKVCSTCGLTEPK